MSLIGKVVGITATAGAAAMLGLGALVFVAPAAANNAAVQSAVQVVTDVDAHGGRGGFCGTAGLDAAAAALNMTADDLQTQLRAGETLSSLADKAGVDVADVLAAVDAACVQAQKDAIEAAVTAGTLTREKADWLLEGLDKGYWGPSATADGFGFGGGRGGFGGFGPGFGPGRGPHGPGNPDDVAPTVTPEATS